MNIRRAEEKDMNGINDLLHQVLMVHHNGRPDLFKGDTKKYTDEELKALIHDDTKPIFVGVDEEETVMGYAFCVFQQHIDDNILTDIKTLYIDDLCVDETLRGQHVGRQLYDYVVQFAKDCEDFGAEGITVHPRPDERHITRVDVPRLKEVVTTEFNIEGNPQPAFRIPK